MSVWKPVDKDEIPESQKGNAGIRKDIIEEFIESGEEAAVITGTRNRGSSLRSCVYNAAKRTGHLGEIEIMLRGSDVYMVRRNGDE